MERIEAHRVFFANLVTANAGLPPGSELAAAFASTPREQFVGPPPWRLFTDGIEAPSDDPACLYQDVVVYALFLLVLWVRPQGLLGTN